MCGAEAGVGIADAGRAAKNVVVDFGVGVLAVATCSIQFVAGFDAGVGVACATLPVERKRVFVDRIEWTVADKDAVQAWRFDAKWVLFCIAALFANDKQHLDGLLSAVTQHARPHQ